jgi:type IV pilus assembly protein PilM
MFGVLNKSVFGIDIGTQTIKISEVRKQGSNISVVNYSIWNDDLSEIIQDKDGRHSLSVDEISRIIKMMMNSAQMNIEEAYIAIPSYLSFSATLSFPIMSEEELAKAVPLEAKQYIPIPLDSVQIDWMNLGVSQDKTKLNVLLIAIPNKVISRYIGVSESLGITIKGFELDTFSLLRSINIPHKHTCVIDIGARTSTVSLINEDKQLQIMQSFDIGGNHITNAIASLKNISASEAEMLKKSNGLIGQDEELSAVVQSILREFILTDVIKLLHQYSDQTGIVIDSMIFVGGLSKMKGLKEFIELVIHTTEQKFQKIEISIASPHKSLRIKEVHDHNTLVDIWNDLVLSIGISIKEYSN